MKTISVSGGNFSLFSLKYSRSLLLIRFRVQAFPAFLPAAIPRRVTPCGFVSIRICRCDVRKRIPFWTTFRYSEGLRTLSSFVSLKPISDRQAHTSFCPSPLEDNSSTLGSHPNAETVSSFTREIARLKCSFHGGSSTLKLKPLKEAFKHTGSRKSSPYNLNRIIHHCS
jgi:hypothetical protein